MAACLAVLAVGTLPLLAQSGDQGTDTQQDSLTNPAAAQSAPQRMQPRVDPRHQPGLIDAVGSFLAESWDTVKSATKLPSSTPDGGSVSPSPSQASATSEPAAHAERPAAEDAAAAAAQTSALIPTLGAGHLVDSRKKCSHAPNGAPDCSAAVLAICNAKGFKTGTSVSIESARNCPVTAWLSANHSPDPDDCRIDAYVTRAACR